MSSREHIFQISMSFDEDMALRAARDQAAEMIFKEVSKAVDNNYRGHYTRSAWSDFAKKLIEERIDGIMHEFKDEIIQAAAVELAARTVRTKAWKERVGE